MSSGLSYSFNKGTYIRKTKNIFKNKCQSYEIVNSPVLSPALSSFKSIDKYLNDTLLLNLFIEFIREHGPFDVIHFNNLEGLSINVLRIKEFFPKTKIVFTIHNYYLFCPQVNLWKNNKENCISCSNGRECCMCVDEYFTQERTVRNYYIMDYYLKKIGISPNGLIWHKVRTLIPKQYVRFKNLLSKEKNDGWSVLVSTSDSKSYYEFQRKNIEYANRYVDVFLAVSKRVKKIAIDRGIEDSRVRVSYIGTKFAEHQIRRKNNEKSNMLNVIYMGYVRRDKGFFFLLHALSVIPKEIACKINLFFAVRTDDKVIIKAMKQLGKKFNAVCIKNGYVHSELEDLLSNIDLGLVPVLWEDNMPQVAIELVSYGIPILSSNLGGAQEISNNPLFIFRANDEEDFVHHIKNFSDNKEKLLEFWNSNIHLVTMSEHKKELEEVYY